MKYPDYWQQACEELSLRDSVLAEIIKTVSPSKEILYSKQDPYHTLAKAIVGQQISLKAAGAIWMRFAKSVRKINPKNVLKCSDEELRTVGLSKQKVNYLKNIAEFFIQKKINNSYFVNQDPTATKQEIMSIKGIGPWTYEMFEIFYLLEPNVFPVKDIGLINAIQRHYIPGNRKIIQTKIKQLSKKWHPWRTVATWYLWRSIDNDIVQY